MKLLISSIFLFACSSAISDDNFFNSITRSRDGKCEGNNYAQYLDPNLDMLSGRAQHKKLKVSFSDPKITKSAPYSLKLLFYPDAAKSLASIVDKSLLRRQEYLFPLMESYRRHSTDPCTLASINVQVYLIPDQESEEFDSKTFSIKNLRIDTKFPQNEPLCQSAQDSDRFQCLSLSGKFDNSKPIYDFENEIQPLDPSSDTVKPIDNWSDQVKPLDPTTDTVKPIDNWSDQVEALDPSSDEVKHLDQDKGTKIEPCAKILISDFTGEFPDLPLCGNNKNKKINENKKIDKAKGAEKGNKMNLPKNIKKIIQDKRSSAKINDPNIFPQIEPCEEIEYKVNVIGDCDNILGIQDTIFYAICIAYNEKVFEVEPCRFADIDTDGTICSHHKVDELIQEKSIIQWLVSSGIFIFLIAIFIILFLIVLSVGLCTIFGKSRTDSRNKKDNRVINVSDELDLGSGYEYAINMVGDQSRIPV
ncbi:MAG: hypothetical protein MHMPM18_000114 [Marteilia pararefringens]